MHRYGRFEIYYSPLVFSQAEVESFAIRKERLLLRLEKMLDLTYDTIIPTYLVYEDINGNWAGYYYGPYIVETRNYVRLDSGHEIAHAVTIRMMGGARTKAMVEGFATFLELRLDGANARKELANDLRWYKCTLTESRLTETFSDTPEVRKNFSRREYILSAAFLEYIHEMFGMEKLKELWRVNTMIDDERFISEFETVLGKSFRSLAEEFVSLYQMEK